MKYSQYLQLREILEENNIKWEDFKKDPQLYEGILSSIGSAAWNLAKKGMKAAVSKGVSSNFKNTLNSNAEKIKNWIIEEVNKGKTDKDHVLNKFFVDKDKLRDIIEDNKNRKTDKSRQIIGEANKQLRSIDKNITSFLRKNIDSQVKRVEQKISKNANITENDKDSLETYWNYLKTQIELGVVSALKDQDIIEEETAVTIDQLLAKEIKKFAGTQSDDEKRSSTKPVEKQKTGSETKQPAQK